MKSSRALCYAVLLVSAVASGGCRMAEPWAFCVTRAMDESGYADGLLESCQCHRQPDEVTLALLLAPLVIDFVLLPITLTHDCVACE